MIRFRILAPASLALALMAACGGKVVVDAPSGAGGNGAGGNGAGGLNTGGSLAQSSTDVGSVTVAVSVGPSTAVSTGVGVGGASPAGGTSVVSVGVGGSGGAPSQVYCNNNPCMDGDVCCFNPNGPGDHCGTAGQCDPGFVQLSCNEPSDCPGAVCCAQIVPNSMTLKDISCQASCDGPGQIVVCSKMEPNVCPAGTMCNKVNQLGNGYRLCF